MQNLIIGQPFFESGALNVLIVILEILAVMGVYASPAIICRYGIWEAPQSPEKAKKFNLIFTICYFIVIAVVLFVLKQGILPLLGILVWCSFNYGILTSGYTDENGNIKQSNVIVGLFDKYQELAIYLIVGVITTVVAWTVFYLLSFVLDSNDGFQLTLNTILNWTAGVLVAYPMNRSWVFKSKSDKKLKEFIEFVASRITTLIIEEVVMLLCVDVIGINQYVSKYVIASILVIILNYVFSKLFVFKKAKPENVE